MIEKFLKCWYDFADDEFEWDPVKSDRNYSERGFDFGFASAIFSSVIFRRRDTRRRDETVFQAIGNANGAILFVVFTIRDHRCRIISARRATWEETELYNG